MGRPREFDADSALRNAMQVFWAKGYEATSLCDLTGAMGLSRSSLYETFGGKQDLFLAALDQYGRDNLDRLAALLAAGGSPRAAIARAFDAVIERLLAEPRPCGCMIGNSAVELAPHDARVRDRLAAALAGIEGLYRDAIRRGQAAGEISTRHDAQALARYLVGSLNGLQVLGKVNPDGGELRQVARLALSVLDTEPETESQDAAGRNPT
ncbi:MAG: TetR/AcrR family transcriptional regulator [Hyphomicrobiales bacterium]|nr:TetR/AcrR family transcriptional regulator [Hyphomicrobiales bacterium]MCP5374050.1 TetR/AcrR family transcriptional regulator [Hyphomicrobiales bacterium]